jgi:hypothetical protein
MGRRPRQRQRRRRHAWAAAGQGPDRFSHLTEDLLRSILNCLPTRSAARLAGVSRHFRREVPRLLERVDSLTLHEPHFPDPLRTTPPLLIRRLALAPHRAIPPSSFRPIIEDAALHGVSEVSFRLTRRARLPKNVFTVKSLVVLALDTCAVPPWSDVSCPCLRTLRLHRVAIHQENINKILASASFLDTLEMVYCTGHGASKGCTVESSSVKNLVFRPTLKLEGTVIRASGLRVLTLYTRSRAKSLELAPAPEIRKVYLHISKPNSMETSMESFKVRPFLDAAVKLECLTLRGQAMKVSSISCIVR